jgi:predicted secreted acid phosphatase
MAIPASTKRGGPRATTMRRTGVVAGTATLALAASALVAAAPADAHGSHGQGRLAPRTHFTMAADGSSGLRADGDGIPNIDSVKKTIYTYYGDPSGTGQADATDSPYVREMHSILDEQRTWLARAYAKSERSGHKPALVFDADDTTLWTYQMEVGDMKFVFTPQAQDPWVNEERFPAVPGMVDFVKDAEAMGFTIFGLTGRSDSQKAATVGNLAKWYGDAFTTENYFTKYNRGTTPPAYLTCFAAPTCTTVEYKAGTRKHIEQDLGYDIVGNFGDQWSDLQGGYADRWVKLPNPTYYLPSPDLPGLREPNLAPRTHFTMKPDGSSGLTQGGEGIPNIDSVKKTVYTYYGDPAGSGVAPTDSSAYISEMAAIQRQERQRLLQKCRIGATQGSNPAIVLDADDTTLWGYNMEVGAMHFVFDPQVQNDDWVQPGNFPATPGMVDFVNAAAGAGCTVVGLTGRNNDQKAATLANLAKVGYAGFTDDLYFTKWTSKQAPPAYVTAADCVAYPKCSTIEYKSTVRKHVVKDLGYDVVANFGDQYSDLIGGWADRTVKLPNPMYYLP